MNKFFNYGCLGLFLICFSYSSCKKEESKPSPVIESFTPISGHIGQPVTITGANLSNSQNATPEVDFNGAMTTVQSSSNSQILVTVPQGAATGKISVKINGLAASSAQDFTVIAQHSIMSFSPTSGSAGTAVTIAGTNFSENAQDNIVKFNNVQASVVNASATSLSVTVPQTATTGKISVSVYGVVVTSSADFNLISPPPTISNFVPSRALPGATISVFGTNFIAGNLTLNKVKIGGVYGVVTAATSTQLQVTVPTVATNSLVSPIVVEVNGQSVTSTTSFEVLIDIPRTGLVAFYPFTNNANDVSGNNLNGLPTNGPSLVYDRYNGGGAYGLDGIDDFINLGNPSQFKISNNLTISAWVRPVLTVSSNIHIASKVGYATGGFLNSGYDLAMSYYSAVGGNYFTFSTYYSTNTYVSSPATSPKIVSNTWYHVAMVVDSNNSSVTYYINGQLTDTKSASPNLLTDGTGNLLLGAGDSTSSVGGFFWGSIDDVAIYNRPLSSSEILQLYQTTITKP